MVVTIPFVELIFLGLLATAKASLACLQASAMWAVGSAGFALFKPMTVLD